MKSLNELEPKNTKRAVDKREAINVENRLPDDYHCDCYFCKKFKGLLIRSDGSFYNKNDRNCYYWKGEVGHIARTPLHLARFLVQRYTRLGQWVFDPTVGAGTTVVEAMNQRRNAVGIDINPLAKLISEVKTSPLKSKELKYVFQIIKEDLKNKKNRIPKVDFFNIDYWFSEKSKHELSRIKFVIASH